MLPTYNTSINTSGFGQDVPGQIAKLRSPAKQSLVTAMAGLSPYARAGVNPQQQAEMDRNFTDTQRASSWGAANDLERQFNAANEKMKFGQLGAATNQANNFFGTANNVAANQRNIAQQGGFNMMSLIGALMGGMPQASGGGF